MPTRLPIPCRAPGCPRLAIKHGYCEEHQGLVKERRRAEDERRGSARERGYSRQWDLYAASLIRKRVVCEVCLAQGRIRPGTMVHHLDPVSEGHPVMAAEDRLLVVCEECHADLHAGRIQWPL